jgi:hypothetical protein
MSLRSLMITGWTVLRRARLIWLFALLAFGIGALDALVPPGPNEYVSFLRYLIVGLAGFYAEVGIIYSAAAALTHQPATFQGAQTLMWKRIASLLLLKGVPALVITLVPSLLIAIIVQAQPAQPNFGAISTWMALINLANLIFLYVFLNPFLAYALNGIIIHHGTLAGSLRRAWRIFTRHIGVTLKISLLYFAAWLLLRSALSAAFLAVQGAHSFGTLGAMVGQSGSGGLAFLLTNLVLSKPAEVAGLVFFTLLLGPLLQILLTQVYLRALGETFEPAEPEVELAPQA